MTLSITNEAALDIMDHNRREGFEKREMELGPHFLRSRTQHKRGPAGLAPRSGRSAVVGRHDRATIQCTHTMDEHSLGRHWPVIVSRLGKAGLAVVPRPAKGTTDLKKDSASE